MQAGTFFPRVLAVTLLWRSRSKSLALIYCSAH